MRLHIRGKNFRVNDDLREHMRLRLGFALGRFGQRIREVTASLADVNGPRGGLDKQCRIVVRLLPSGKVTIEETALDFMAATARAADRAGRAVGRELERRREARVNGGGMSPPERE
jgi:ribosome-associated translation inhibitor RaiA